MRATWTVIILRSSLQLQETRRAMPSGLVTVWTLFSRTYGNPQTPSMGKRCHQSKGSRLHRRSCPRHGSGTEHNPWRQITFL